LSHIAEAITRIGRYTDGMNETSFLMRNVVAHRYFKVDFQIVWKTIQTDLPAFKTQVDALLATPSAP
ncbi:MAG TPA: HepT-like ribonuclease domain-containing protein, partial [Burkholderiaceae bacterium]|nr:HepT-like ribonuclease domain-containing protein [Burkholderiaceae bacterium]